ncbi:MAG: hypothetical protein LBV39_01520 [Bacteroidales bacterium]|jgi:hypothetical protein|nr:hypothetical protein [Bacteroidales bacterium]
MKRLVLLFSIACLGAFSYLTPVMVSDTEMSDALSCSMPVMAENTDTSGKGVGAIGVVIENVKLHAILCEAPHITFSAKVNGQTTFKRDRPVKNDKYFWHKVFEDHNIAIARSVDKYVLHLQTLSYYSRSLSEIRRLNI